MSLPVSIPVSGSIFGLAPAFVRLRHLVLPPLLAVALLAAASFLGPVPDAAATTRSQRISHAATIATQQIGDRYQWGATGPDAFDCSGLMQYSFRRAGITIPRTSSAQAQYTRRIYKRNLRRGDLMFFHNGGRVYHVAMFLKRVDGRIHMVNAPGTGKRVRIDSPWTSQWFAGTLR